MASKLCLICLSSLWIFIVLNESNVEAVRRRSFPHENIRVDESSNLKEKKWISRLFLEAEMSFDIHPNVSSRCKYDYELYLSHLKNQSVWAVRSKPTKTYPDLTYIHVQRLRTYNTNNYSDGIVSVAKIRIIRRYERTFWKLGRMFEIEKSGRSRTILPRSKLDSIQW